MPLSTWTRIRNSRAQLSLLIARNRIERLSLTTGPDPKPPASSLHRRLGVPLDCISPDCQVGSDRDGILHPFGADRG